jgi:pimeloyl-ACP methyl ester carboxylesterase
MRAPALYPDSELERPGGPRRSTVQTPETATALRALAHYDGPALVLESEHDELIPHRIVEAYLTACRHGRHEIMLGVGHALDDERSRAHFVELIVSWFGETLAAGTTS